MGARAPRRGGTGGCECPNPNHDEVSNGTSPQGGAEESPQDPIARTVKRGGGSQGHAVGQPQVRKEVGPPEAPLF